VPLPQCRRLTGPCTGIKIYAGEVAGGQSPAWGEIRKAMNLRKYFPCARGVNSAVRLALGEIQSEG
jgi:hypothetical protein